MQEIMRPNRIQVLLSYSEERRKEMKAAKEKSCQGLVDLVRDIIEKELAGKVEKVSPLGKGFADLLIEGIISDGEKLRRFEDAMKKINKDVGAEKVYIFAKEAAA